jgi:hypothetical protein
VIAIIPIVVAMAASPIPFLALDYSGFYLTWMLSADIVLLYAIWCLFGPAERVDLVSRSSALIKAGVSLGIIALFAA